MTRFNLEYPEFNGLLLQKKMYIINDYNRSFQNEIPKTLSATILLLINNTEYIINTFDTNKEPTAKKDPYNFKKKIIIIIKSILKNKVNFDFMIFLSIALSIIKTIQNKDIIISKIMNFMLNRIQHNLKMNIDFIKNRNNLLIIKNISQSFKQIGKYKFFSEFISIIKRIKNFCRKQKLQNIKFNIQYQLKIEEKNLFKKIIKNIAITRILKKNQLYFELFKLKLSIKKNIDEFFKNIFILSENIKERNNRIVLIYLCKYYINRQINFNKKIL